VPTEKTESISKVSESYSGGSLFSSRSEHTLCWVIACLVWHSAPKAGTLF